MFKSIIGIIFLVGVNTHASPLDTRPSTCRETEVRVNEVPLPRRNQLTIQWDKMSGSWEAGRFVFRLGRVISRGTNRFISVSMIDPISKNVLREGGVAIRADGLRASGILADTKTTGVGKKADDTFIIFRRFKEEDSTGRPTNRNLYVVTIRTLREKTKICDETHYEMVRNRKTMWASAL